MSDESAIIPVGAVDPAIAHNAAILAALEVIDAKTIRPLREGDAARVAALEEQASQLRAQLIKVVL